MADIESSNKRGNGSVERGQTPGRPDTSEAQSSWILLKEKALAFGRRLIGTTESHLLPAEAERMDALQDEAEKHLKELLQKADAEKSLSDSFGEVDIVENRHRYFDVFLLRMERVFPDDFELWQSINVYFGTLDGFHGITRFTDFGFLAELDAIDSKNLLLLKYSFMTLAHMDERYAEYFLAYAMDFGGLHMLPRVYNLILDYPKRLERGEIDRDHLGRYIQDHLGGAIYR